MGCTIGAGGYEDLITFKVETEREDDGRWLAEVLELPGVLAYGESQEAAVSKVQALALRVIAERLEHGEAGPDLLSISSRLRDRLAEQARIAKQTGLTPSDL